MEHSLGFAGVIYAKIFLRAGNSSRNSNEPTVIVHYTFEFHLHIIIVDAASCAEQRQSCSSRFIHKTCSSWIIIAIVRFKSDQPNKKEKRADMGNTILFFLVEITTINITLCNTCRCCILFLRLRWCVSSDFVQNKAFDWAFGSFVRIFGSSIFCLLLVLWIYIMRVPRPQRSQFIEVALTFRFEYFGCVNPIHPEIRSVA